jgi:hypothetical protein
MSHVTGTVQPVSPPLTFGPGTGAPPTSPGVWAVGFAHQPAPGGTRLLILHFTNAQLFPGNAVEVDLGYGMDVFTDADGPDFWTRPINPYTLPNGKVPIRYIGGGPAPIGTATLDKYGRGEPHAGEQDPTSISNATPSSAGRSSTSPTTTTRSGSASRRRTGRTSAASRPATSARRWLRA